VRSVVASTAAAAELRHLTRKGKPVIPLKVSEFSSLGAWRRTPESPLRGMFQAPGPYVRMKNSPPTRLCPDFDTDIRSDPIGVRMIAYTSIKTKNFSRFPMLMLRKRFLLSLYTCSTKTGYLLP